MRRIKQRIRKKRKDAGISLISAMVALIILGMGLIGLLNLMIVLSATGASTSLAQRANLLVDSKIEELKTVSYAQLLKWVEENDGVFTDADSVDGVFYRQWTVKPSTLQQGLLRIEVTVQYRPPQGAVRSISRVTLRSNYD